MATFANTNHVDFYKVLFTPFNRKYYYQIKIFKDSPFKKLYGGVNIKLRNDTQLERKLSFESENSKIYCVTSEVITYMGWGKYNDYCKNLSVANK